MYYIFSILLLFLIIVLLFFINKSNKLLKIVNQYEKIIDDQGKKNHEFNNQLLILMGYIDNKEKLREYLYTIVEDHKTGQNYEIRQLSHIPPGGIKNILYYKINKIKNNKIKYYLYVSEDVFLELEKLNIKLYKEITMILGVFLDNAIEAAKISKDKEIIIDLKKDDTYLIISISNSYKDNININKIGKKKYTTKGNGHGYGLLLVNEIIKENKKLELVTEDEEKMIKQTLLVDLK